MTDLEAFETLLHKLRRSQMRGQKPALHKILGAGQHWFAVIRFPKAGEAGESDEEIWHLEPDSGDHGWKRWYTPRSVAHIQGRSLITRMAEDEKPDNHDAGEGEPNSEVLRTLLLEVARLTEQFSTLGTRFSTQAAEMQRLSGQLTLLEHKGQTQQQQITETLQWRRDVDHRIDLQRTTLTNYQQTVEEVHHAMRTLTRSQSVVEDRVERVPEDVSGVVGPMVELLAVQIEAIQEALGRMGVVLDDGAEPDAAGETDAPSSTAPPETHAP